MAEPKTSTADRGSAAVGDRPFTVDCDTHNLPFPQDLAPYLPERWRDYLATYGLRTPSEFGLVRARFYGSRTDAWPPSGRPPGNDPEFFLEDMIDRYGIDRAIINSLAPNAQIYFGGNQPQAFSSALMTAANDWTREEWLALDERLYASICVPVEHGPDAVAEIEKRAADGRFVQVLLPFRTQKPIGNPRYWDFIEAAVAHDLPIAFHPGGTGNNTVTGNGWPSYYYEDHTGLPQALYHQVASLVTEGVFDRFPTLRIVFQEGGWSWIAPMAWRFDRAWRQLRSEVPHLQRKPSEYIGEHFYVTTQPIEEPERPDQFVAALEQSGFADRLMFSSDYPHWDFDAPGEAIPRSLPEELRHRIYAGTALDLYGLPGEVAA